MNNSDQKNETRPVDADRIRKQVIVDVVHARLRQVTELGFDAEVDDDHTDGEEDETASSTPSEPIPS
jgi:hypothetical protein